MRKITILDKVTIDNDIEKIGNIFNTNLDFQLIPEIVNLTGVSFEDRQLIIPKLKIGEPAHLIRDPYNEYDKYAIKVFYKDKHIGWVPRDIAFYLSQEMDAGILWSGTIKEITGNEDTLRGVIVKLFYLNK